MTETAMLPSDVGAALSLREFVDACENDPPPPGKGPLPAEKARRLEELVARAVQMASTLKTAWGMCIQGGKVWETGPYVRRMQAVEFWAGVVVDILTRTQEIVVRTSAAHSEWIIPSEMGEVQSNLPAARDILAKTQELLAAKFHNLASRWKRETRSCSSRTKMIDHPAYKEIIGMGPAALPFILGELRTDPRYWFPALHEITGQDPVPAEDRGSVEKMAEAWLQWGKTHGF